jgi:hypothetical protein
VRTALGLDDGLDATLDRLFRLDGVAEPSAQEILRDLGEMIDVAGDRAALYVYARALGEWEQTDEYDRIKLVTRELGNAVRAPDRRDAPDGQVLQVIADQAELIGEAMDVENGMNCSCAVAMGRHAGRLVEGMTALLARQDLLAGAGSSGVLAQLRSDARCHRVAYEAVREMADGLYDFLMDGGNDVAVLARVADRLRAAEDDPAVRGDVYASELRTYRTAVEALESAAESPRLILDAADITYLYPFALGPPKKETERAEPPAAAVAQAPAESSDAAPGDEPEKLPDQAFDEWERWRLGAARVRPERAEKYERTGMWRDRHPGCLVALPLLEIDTTAGERLRGLTPEILIHKDGNHYLRITYPLAPVRVADGAGRPADLHDLNQAMRRASRGMGAERIAAASAADALGTRSGASWPRLMVYAEEIIMGVARALGREVEVDVDRDCHVVITAREVSVEDRSGRRPAGPADLREAVGSSLLLNPVRQLATSLEEWIRYPPPRSADLLDGLGYSEELVVRTANTTVLFTPASPDWFTDQYREMAEYIASLPALLHDQYNRLHGHAEQLRQDLHGAEDMPVTPALADLHKRDIELRELESSFRGRAEDIRAPALSRTFTQRELLRRLWDASGLSDLERGVSRQHEVLQAVAERLSATLKSVEQKQHERRQRLLQVLGALLTALSITGVLSWANALDQEGLTTILAEVLLLALIIVLVIFLYTFIAWRRGTGGGR